MKKQEFGFCKPIGGFASVAIFALSCFSISAHAQSTESAAETQLQKRPSDVLSERIDQLVDKRIAEAGWQRAEPCSDAAFVRRAYLDLTGAPPKASEVLDFMEDGSEGKRSTLIRRLLRSPIHAEHLSSIWTSWLVAEGTNDAAALQQDGLKNWLRQRFAENLRYDRLVADLLVSTGSIRSGPTAFFAALEGKPEKIAARTARVFMGVQLDCAECHDHPFDRWKQEDFWGLAAYFAQITPSGEGEAAMQVTDVYDTESGEVTLPGTDRIVSPRPLVQTASNAQATGTRRQQLTLWLTTRENPFLARATVNRVWAILMGRGLIEPVDDMRDTLAASHPELLDELSDYFTTSGYELRQLVEAIATTKTYSQDTRHTSGAPPEELFAAMQTKPLSERQFANSIVEVARQLGQTNRLEVDQLVSQLGQLRGEASQAKVGIVNALVTLHGDLLDRTSSEHSSRLLAALQAPHLDEPAQIRWLYLSTLNRLPSQQEEQFFSTLSGTRVESSSEQNASAQSAPPWQSDLLWALLNSTEFAMTP